jgi:photosystem II stability/assembly factor-like uncharacterized protein
MSHYRLIGPLVVLAVGVAGSALIGQSQAPASPPAIGPFDSLHFRPLGPASMSGRISDVAVYEPNPAIFYVGTGHGGVWKTVNNGTTFEAQMQDRGLMSIGDIAVSQNNPDLVWVGTGESNNRQSTSWGDGVYKSIDGGKSYTFTGLRSSRFINRIVIDPRNNEIVYVASTGSLWGPGGERGVFKTTDGGKAWKQVLKVDDDTGANDLVIDAADSRVLYASTYQRRRTACCMNGGGPGSGIWKSTDAGETWSRLKTGIPEGSLGRIGLDVSRRRSNILYASIEGPVAPGRGGRGAAAGGEESPEGAVAQAGGGAGRGGAGGGGFGRGGGPLNNDPTGLYRSDDAGSTWKKVNNANPRPMYFSQVRIDPNDTDIVYLGGVGLHQTLDAGKTIATDIAQPIHDDIHAIWIDPSNSNHLIIGNDGGLAYSYDQGKTWVFVPNLPVGLFYHVSYDMATPFNVCGGMQDNYDWCGPSAVRGSSGIANHHWTTIQGGDGFVVLQDPESPRVIYSESQDGNMVRVDRVTGETMSIRPQAATGEPPLRWHWDTPIILSPHDPKVVYTAAQKVLRSADRGLSWTPISADLTSEAKRDDIVTMGLKGSEIRIAKDDGIVAWPTIVALAESPKRAGLVYAGTDDGNLHVSRDAGKTWMSLYSKLPNAPKGGFVSEVAASRFDEGTVYVTIDDHRQDNFETYIYSSTDFGQTWRPANGNLTSEVVKTVTEDLRNPDVLYLGTETGLFISVDRAKTWTRVHSNLPSVRIDEIALHPRDNAMLLATHGRSLWILDHLEPIQEYAAAQSTSADAKLFTPPPAAMYRRPARDRNYEFWGDQTFFGENPPQAAVISWFMKRPANEVKLKITDAAGKDVREIAGATLANSNKAGMQSACWDLRVQPAPAVAAGGGGRQGGGGRGGQTVSPFGAGCNTGGGGFGGFGFGGGGGNPGPYVLPGVYNVTLIVDGKTVETKSLRVADDPEVVLTSVERKKLFDMAMEMHELQKRGAEVANALTPLNTKVAELASQVSGSTEIPADVKASFDQLNKELAELMPKFAQPAGGRGGAGGGAGGAGAATAGAGGGRGGASESVMTQVAQAKNGLMGGMWPGEQTTKAYAETKTKMPKAIAEANALLAKAQTLSSALTKYNITLPVTAATLK